MQIFSGVWVKVHNLWILFVYIFDEDYETDIAFGIACNALKIKLSNRVLMVPTMTPV